MNGQRVSDEAIDVALESGVAGAKREVLLDLRDCRRALRASEAKLAAAKEEIVNLAGIMAAKSSLVMSDDVISEDALRELFGLDDDDTLGKGPHQVCNGEWFEEDGFPGSWRFYWERVLFEEHVSATAESALRASEAARVAAEAKVGELREALASNARVDTILSAVLVKRDDPEDGTRDHLPRVLRDFLSEENGKAGLTGWNDGYAEGYAKAKSEDAARSLSTSGEKPK